MLKAEIYLPREFLPAVPSPMRAITGDQGKIEEAGQRFFDGTLDYLGMTKRARQVFSQVSMRPLDKFDANTSSFHMEEARITEDALIYLIVRDLPIASLFIRRDDNNWIQGSFASYLDENLEAHVRRRLIPPGSKIIYEQNDWREHYY